MKEQYFEGLLAAGRDCINYGRGMDFSAGLIGRAENDYQRGERFALRTFRDHEEAEAIDLITARLWKWGAEKELDRFLAFIGMDPESEPDPLDRASSTGGYESEVRNRARRLLNKTREALR